jgi:hypothetical protein
MTTTTSPSFRHERATFESFLSSWSDHLSTSPTVREAYERTEDDHLEIYGRRRFAEFSSFARARRVYFAQRHRIHGSP